jgi:tRNA A-37 threonylcarbamoyl transferase component Bud32/membrane-associated phospholipid phosphatase
MNTEAPVQGSAVTVEPRGRRKRRRPSGEAPPLPRDLKRSGRLLLWSIGAIFLLLVSVAFVSNLGEHLDSYEAGIVRWVSTLRTSFLTKVAHGIENAMGAQTMIVLRWGALLTLLAFKRFRHLFVFLGSTLLVGLITTNMGLLFVRSRPLDVDIIGRWQGSSIPSRPAAAVAVTLLSIIYSLLAHGRQRNIAKWVCFFVIFLFAANRIYLGVDHPIDLAIGILFGVAVPVVAFRTLTPNDAFPVSYRRGRAAHLDIEGARGTAIRSAVNDQLGLTVVDMKAFGLAGSGGSTPMRLEVEGGQDRYVFAKLYAAAHLRADRWYKLGRTLLYGRLEDEASFSTVRRLVQYEDYMLRVMRDAGVNSPRPYGFVEITPEREYVIVMEMIDGARELVAVPMTDAIILSGLREVRKLWDAGLAHRDIKPSNVLIRDDEVFLIDVAFGQTRPSPWREAVDLANMMLVLAMASDTQRVYRLACSVFTPDEIAEAFAATQRVTMPSQSRQMLRKDHRDLVTEFRKLAPARRPVAIQRWSVRRASLTIACAVGAIIIVSMAAGNLRGAGLTQPSEATRASFALVVRSPDCEGLHGLEPSMLVAQSVPSATFIPCTKAIPQGWQYKGMDVQNGKTRIFFDSDRSIGADSEHELVVELQPSCTTSGEETSSGWPGIRRFDDVAPGPDAFSGTRRFTFEGGCIVYRFEFGGDDWPNFVSASSLTLDFRSRDALNRRVERRLGLSL